MAARSQQANTSPGSSTFAFVEVTPPPEDGNVEPDDEGARSGNDSEDKDEWMSIKSSIYRGIIENGRRYQALKEGEYWGPSDEQQFESMANTHLYLQLYDREEENILFRSPIPDNATHILDIGTGPGEWAIDVADKFPHITVHGVDLSPPPEDLVPPNCIFEVDDVTKPWTWNQKFDLIHLRYMFGAFTDSQWRRLYWEAYRNLKPGGWIEHIEPDIRIDSDDNTIPPGSAMSRWGDLFLRCAETMGTKMDTIDTMRGFMEEAGFVNFHQKDYKIPKGPWPKHALMKEIGKIHLAELMAGMEGYSLVLLTKFGSPKPWTTNEVQLYLMQMRQELKSSSHHAYAKVKRVWCQKPLEERRSPAAVNRDEARDE